MAVAVEVVVWVFDVADVGLRRGIGVGVGIGLLFHWGWCCWNYYRGFGMGIIKYWMG